MEYEQFVDEFIDKLQQNIEQENVEIRRGTFTKINEKLDGIAVKYPDSPVAPTVYLDEKYQMVQATVVSSADKLTENIYKVDAQSKQISIVDISSLTEGESIEKEVVKSHGKSH